MTNLTLCYPCVRAGHIIWPNSVDLATKLRGRRVNDLHLLRTAEYAVSLGLSIRPCRSSNREEKGDEEEVVLTKKKKKKKKKSPRCGQRRFQSGAFLLLLRSIVCFGRAQTLSPDAVAKLAVLPRSSAFVAPELGVERGVLGPSFLTRLFKLWAGLDWKCS